MNASNLIHWFCFSDTLALTLSCLRPSRAHWLASCSVAPSNPYYLSHRRVTQMARHYYRLLLVHNLHRHLLLCWVLVQTAPTTVRLWLGMVLSLATRHCWGRVVLCRQQATAHRDPPSLCSKSLPPTGRITHLLLPLGMHSTPCSYNIMGQQILFCIIDVFLLSIIHTVSPMNNFRYSISLPDGRLFRDIDPSLRMILFFIYHDTLFTRKLASEQCLTE